MNIRILFPFLFMICGFVFFASPLELICQLKRESPILVTERIANKIINETSFDFTLVPQIPAKGIQSLNFENEYPGIESRICYALATIYTPVEKISILGLEHSAQLRVWINDKCVYSRNDTTSAHEEFAYEMYSFPVESPVHLKAGNNTIMVKALVNFGSGLVRVGLLNQKKMVDTTLEIRLSEIADDSKTQSPWLLVGPFTSGDSLSKLELSTIFPPEGQIKKYYNDNNIFYNWQSPKKSYILKEVINPLTTFKKHSYFEWHYANGQMMLAMLALADASGKSIYSEYVRTSCELTLRLYSYFAYQYRNLQENRGFNYRIYRKSMLDDTSAPALPFIELFIHELLPEAKELISLMAHHVSKKQLRLSDGTLCRPEPVPNTIWADDLFMSVPFLVRYAKIEQDASYLDDAVLQIKQYHKYLFNYRTQLYAHGWYANQQKQSVSHWGRANGWIAWALTEALLSLPKSHNDYHYITSIFQEQMKGIVMYQSTTGLWHQILDNPDSFEEISSSAMFVLALARGIRNGWISKSYEEHMLRGWDGIAKNVSSDGIVSGICQGTEIGDSVEYYLTRKTLPNDPRGLGAVLMAGIEVGLMSNNVE